MVVKRGSTIASLLAAVFKDDCLLSGVQLDEHGIIKSMYLLKVTGFSCEYVHTINKKRYPTDLDCPLMSKDNQEQLKEPDFKEGHNQKHPTCLAASDLAGSRMSKVN